MQAASRLQQLLHLADNALILGHRLSEWCGHGPALEQDIALSNIALDHVGLSRNLYQYAADLINEHGELKQDYPLHTDGQATEDSLAYLRDAYEYRNFLLLELPNGDWAVTTLRLYCFALWQQLLLRRLQTGDDVRLAGIAAKSVKEVDYHVKWSGDWIVRLGDGTEESARRLGEALNLLWPYVGELFEPKGPAFNDLGEDAANALQVQWQQIFAAIFAEANLPVPSAEDWYQTGGTKGHHSEHLGYLLAEMQFLQRAYPGAEW